MVDDGHRDDEDAVAHGAPSPPPAESWEGRRATVNQAMEWGIELCGQLAAIHHEDVVVGVIGPSTITCDRFGRPRLPEPDPRAANAPWADVAAVAGAVRGLVEDPPADFLHALLPPYATAVALGQELQDAQRRMGLPVAPISFEGAPPTLSDTFGFGPQPEPPQVGPEPGESSETLGPGADDEDVAAAPDPVVQAELDRRPQPWVLLAVAVVVLVAAVAIGLGWT